MDVIMNKKLIELKKQERNKIRQQERLLIKIAKEYKKLLEASGKTEDELKQFLGKNCLSSSSVLPDASRSIR